MHASAPKRLTIHVLDGAEELPFVTLDSLPAVVRALASFGAVIVVEYDGESERLKFYRQKEWLPAGQLSYEEELTAVTPEEGGRESAGQAIGGQRLVPNSEQTGGTCSRFPLTC